MMDIQWGLVGQARNNFENALARGLEIGERATARQEQREYRNALLQQDQQELDYRRQAAETAASEKRAAEQREQMAQFRGLLEAAGENPQQAFAAAQSLGIDLGSVPQPGTPEFEPWRQTQLFIVNAAEKDPELLTNTAKEVMLSLPPEHRNVSSPVFIEAMGRAMAKVMPTQAGGGVASVNPITGKSDFLIVPNDGSRAAGAPVGERKTIGTRTFVKRGDEWFEETGGSNAAPTFPPGS